MTKLHPAGLFVLALATAAIAAPDDDGPNPSGEWKIVTEGGKGKVSIKAAERGPKRYELSWNTPRRDYDGIGLVRHGHLFGAWGTDSDGVMVWRLDGAAWKAQWVHKTHTDEKLGEETIKGPTLAGKHSVEGKHPNGNEYKGEVEIEKTGDVYKLTWKVGDRTYHGVGIEAGEGRLAVAYGRKDFGCILYDLAGGADEIQGKWAGRDDTTLHVEKLRKKK